MHEPTSAGKAEEKPGLLKLLVDNCLKNVYVWLFAIAYFFVYVVRQGVTSWFIFYLKVSLWQSHCLAYEMCIRSAVHASAWPID